MKIYRSVKTNLLSQGFGAANTKPGMTDLYKSLGFDGHEGLDWGVQCQDNQVKTGGHCEQVYCDLDIKATITTIQTSVEYGFGIVARTEDADGIYEHLWWHFDAIAPNLSVGSVIESGDLLGVSGNTGRTTGAHLHRELRPLGKDQYGNYYKSQPNNGYKGAIDPTPFMTNIFILDVISGLQQQISILQKLIALVKKLLNK